MLLLALLAWSGARLRWWLLGRLRPAALPQPTGRHRVGRLAVDWEDAAREDPYARRSPEPRTLALTVWYPADVAEGARRAPYLPGWWRLTGLTAGIRLSRVRGSAVEWAPVTRAAQRCPVLVFSPAAFPPHCYTALLEELASHGYVVVGVAHPHEALPVTAYADGGVRWFNAASVGGALGLSKRPHAEDVGERGAVLDEKAADLCFVADRLRRPDAGPAHLAGRLDPERVGVLGHSFGGGAAQRACARDPGFRAGADLDGGLWLEPAEVALTQPFLLLFGEHPEYVQPCAESVRQGTFANEEYCEQDRALQVGAWQALWERAHPGVSIKVSGALHTDFMDWQLLPLWPWSVGRRRRGAVEGRRLHRLVSDTVLAFFAEHLDALGPPPPDEPELIDAPPARLFPLS
jgi:hypothetical protein